MNTIIIIIMKKINEPRFIECATNVIHRLVGVYLRRVEIIILST